MENPDRVQVWLSIILSLSLCPSFQCLSNCLTIDRGQAFLISKSAFKWTLIRLKVSSLRVYLKAHLEMRMWHWTEQKSVLVTVWKGPGFRKPHGTQNKYSKTFYSVVESPDWTLCNCRKNARQWMELTINLWLFMSTGLRWSNSSFISCMSYLVSSADQSVLMQKKCDISYNGAVAHAHKTHNICGKIKFY